MAFEGCLWLTRDGNKAEEEEERKMNGRLSRGIYFTRDGIDF